MSALHFDAVIFDLDGVITQTAQIHSAAWKNTFDEYLKLHEKYRGIPFKEFTHNDDYLPFVDGKPRYKGVESFLRSRGISLPYGSINDPPGKETVCGLGNLKDQKFNDILKRDGVKVYKSSVVFIEELKRKDIRVGVASSSKNCSAILKTAGIRSLFEVRIDGIVSAQLKLKGKPEPDIFTTACCEMEVSPDRAIIVEDAVSGVLAGKRGGFGLVVGIARENNKKDLITNGADIAVRDLAEIDIDRIEQWFTEELPKDQWSIDYYDFSKENEKHRESLCAVGNGYFATRGTSEETQANDIHYPGTYIAGIYNRLKSSVAGKTVVNEDLVNCPNWLATQFRIGKDEWFDFTNMEITDFHRHLDMKRGILYRRIVTIDKKGRETLVESSRLASMADPHIAAMQYSITPLNYSDSIGLRTGIVFNVTNSVVERYRQLESRHLDLVAKGGTGNHCYVLTETNQSKIRIAEAMKVVVSSGNKKINTEIFYSEDNGGIYSCFSTSLTEGCTLTFDKLVSIYTSRDVGLDDPLSTARKSVATLKDFNEVAEGNEKARNTLWQKVDIKVKGDRFSQNLLRLNIYHLLTTASVHNNEIDCGIPARGLHGEAYRGHIFWDELFILPFYNLHLPKTAKSVLLYRYRRLNKAREYAKEYNCQGALYPWQSGSDGSEETQTYHLNPISGAWGKDFSRLQHHVSIAIAYSIWYYYWTTLDFDFLARYGAEMFFEIARFWESKTKFDQHTGRYIIDNVMGPDEFHEKHPDTYKAGLKNNSYTNFMVVWLLRKANEILNLLSHKAKQSVVNKIKLTDEETVRWIDISKKMTLVTSKNGVIAQFDEYFNLRELDLGKYRSDYGDITRLDRILKANGTSPDIYKVAKQADTLMIFYLLPSDELTSIFSQLGFTYKDDTVKKNFDYYYGRTSHGSTLSKMVHSYIASFIGYNDLSWNLYRQSLESDYTKDPLNTTGEGIHTGVMAGTVLHVLRVYAGIDISKKHLQINPSLPKTWKRISFNINFRKNQYGFKISSKRLYVSLIKNNTEPEKIDIRGKSYTLYPGESRVIDLS